MMLLECIADQRRINTVKIVIGAQPSPQITIFDWAWLKKSKYCPILITENELDFGELWDITNRLHGTSYMYSHV